MQPLEMQIRALNPGDVADFPLAEQHQALSDYLHLHALIHQDRKLSLTWGGFIGDRLVAYITLIASEIKSEQSLGAINDGQDLKWRPPNSPAIKIARYAVIEELQGKGYGRQLMSHAKGVSVIVSKFVGCRFLILDAKQDAIPKYEKMGFRILGTSKNRRKPQPAMWLDLFPENPNPV